MNLIMKNILFVLSSITLLSLSFFLISQGRLNIHSRAEVDYVTADATFAYTIYKVERLIGEH